MDEKVLEQARRLSDALSGSKEYIAFRAAQEALKELPDTYRQVSLLRRDYFATLVTNEMESDIQVKYRELLAIEQVRDYFEKEQNFCTLMQQVYDILQKEVAFDMSFVSMED